MTNSRLPTALTGAMHSLLRVITAGVFMEHGLQKLFGVLLPPDKPFTGAPAMFSQFWIAGTLETFGGALLLLGLFTRPVAFLLAGEMAVAYFQFHLKRGFWPIQNSGETVVLLCFASLYFFAAGPGPYSFDDMLLGRRRTA